MNFPNKPKKNKKNKSNNQQGYGANFQNQEMGYNTQAPLYHFHPQYGFIPADQYQGGNNFENQDNNEQGSYEQNSYGENPYGQNPYGQAPHGMTPPPYACQNPYMNTPPYAPFAQGHFPPPFPHGPHYGQGFGHMHGGNGHPYHAMHANHMAHMAFMAQMAQAQNEQGQNNQNAQSGQGQAFDMERMNEIYNTVGDVMNGKAKPNKLLGLFQNISTDFWKGFALGAGALALYNYSPLKDLLGAGLGSLLANMQNGQGFDDDLNDFDDDFGQEESPCADTPSQE